MDLNVVARVRIMPTGVEVDMNKIKKELGDVASKYGRLHSADIKPIAFGLSAIEANLLLSDDSGGMDDLVEKIKKIDGVGDVELQEASRL